MKTITPETFLETLFPPDITGDETVVAAHPDSFVSRETGKRVDYYRQMNARRADFDQVQSWYFCVSTVVRQRQRQIKKRLEDVRTAMVLVVDDIGTKSEEPPVPPSYTLETSAGNFQWGYLIEPFDVSTPAGQAYYDSILYSLAAAGMNDEGFRSASRLARLPGSLHRTDWVARVREWEPSRIWELEDLAGAFSIPLKEPRKLQALKPGKYTRLEDVNDPVYDMLVADNRVLGHNDQWVYIECPWRHAHTEGAQGATSTAYSPEDYGRAGRGFKCLHGHCAKRGLDDFVTELARTMNRDNAY